MFGFIKKNVYCRNELMSKANEKIHIKWYETCKCKCKDSISIINFVNAEKRG